MVGWGFPGDPDMKVLVATSDRVPGLPGRSDAVEKTFDGNVAAELVLQAIAVQEEMSSCTGVEGMAWLLHFTS